MKMEVEVYVHYISVCTSYISTSSGIVRKLLFVTGGRKSEQQNLKFGCYEKWSYLKR